MGDAVWNEHQDLIDVLLDRSARWDERDDAAMDLSDADEPAALDALTRVGCDAAEDDTLLESVGEAIAEILSRHPDRTDNRIADLAPVARSAYLRARAD